jgi:alpha-L-fucosidase
VTFARPETVQYIVLQEYIRLGQRVRSFVVEARTAAGWAEVSHGTTIGYKRILKFNPVTTDGFRIRITDAKACLAISNLGLY